MKECSNAAKTKTIHVVLGSRGVMSTLSVIAKESLGESAQI